MGLSRRRLDEIPAKLDGVSSFLDGNTSVISIVVTADEERDKCRMLINRLARLIVPGEPSQKIRRGKISEMTGIPARRVKDYALGAIKEPSSHQVRTLENALKVALALARETALEIDELELERAEIKGLIGPRVARVAGGMGAQAAHDRWERAVSAGVRTRAMGKS